MKQIDLGDVRDSLALNQFVIEVPAPTATKARLALERMVAA
jgi:quinolinate synthase